MVGPTIADVQLYAYPLVKLRDAAKTPSVAAKQIALAQVIIADLGNALAHALLAVVAPLCVLMKCDVRQVALASKTHAIISARSVAACVMSLPGVVNPQIALNVHSKLGFKAAVPAKQKSWLRVQGKKVSDVVLSKEFAAAALLAAVTVGAVTYSRIPSVPLPPPPPEPFKMPPLGVRLTVYSALFSAIVFPSQTGQFAKGVFTGVVRPTTKVAIRAAGWVTKNVLVTAKNGISLAYRVAKPILRPIVKALATCTSKGVREVAKVVIEVVKGVWAITKPILRDVVGPPLRWVLEGVGSNLKSVVKGVGEVVGAIWREIGQNISLEPLMDALRGVVTHLTDVLKSVVRGIGTELWDLICGVGGVAKDIFTELYPMLSPGLEFLGTQLRSVASFALGRAAALTANAGLYLLGSMGMAGVNLAGGGLGAVAGSALQVLRVGAQASFSAGRGYLSNRAGAVLGGGRDWARDGVSAARGYVINQSGPLANRALRIGAQAILNGTVAGGEMIVGGAVALASGTVNNAPAIGDWLGDLVVDGANALWDRVSQLDRSNLKNAAVMTVTIAAAVFVAPFQIGGCFIARVFGCRSGRRQSP